MASWNVSLMHISEPVQMPVIFSKYILKKVFPLRTNDWNATLSPAATKSKLSSRNEHLSFSVSVR